MGLRISNILVIALMLLAVNFAFCAALIRARSHYAAALTNLSHHIGNKYETHQTDSR
jgi:hypothetical protein